jgi:two-component system, cell cycle sensor histidine kinase and response regulator CckA
LSMAAVQGIVENHKGFIHLESKPGQGTLVRIYLPAT